MSRFRTLEQIEQLDPVTDHQRIVYLSSQYEMAPGGDIFTGPGVIDASNVDAIIELTAAGYR